LKLGAILNTVQGSLVPDMTYNVFGGTLNPAQSNPMHAKYMPIINSFLVKKVRKYAPQLKVAECRTTWSTT